MIPHIKKDTQRMFKITPFLDLTLCSLMHTNISEKTTTIHFIFYPENEAIRLLQRTSTVPISQITYCHIPEDNLHCTQQKILKFHTQK